MVPPGSSQEVWSEAQERELDRAKRTMRTEAIARRRGIAAGIRADAPRSALAHLCAQVPFAGDAAISAYWPFPDEFDPRDILRELHRDGHLCLLPVVRGRRTPLIFRRWRPGDILASGPFGTSTPSEGEPEGRPDLLLVPLLAFDRHGFRLGYGGGYYDRTLLRLRSDGGRRPLAVGLGFAAQEVDRVPRGPRDAALDWILTEVEAVAFAGAELGGEAR